MSQANASARKRRAPAPVVAPPGSSTNTPQFSQNSAQQQQPQTPSSGLTLPQVILLVDKRLTTLEKFMNTTNTFIETQKNVQPSVTVESTPESDENVSSEQLDGIVEEFNSRYAMLAEEIANLKDMLLKLSSYTMEVNKKLFEQHISNTPTIIKNSSANDFSHCEEEQLFVLPSSENSTETLSEENSSNIITFMSEE